MAWEAHGKVEAEVEVEVGADGAGGGGDVHAPTLRRQRDAPPLDKHEEPHYPHALWHKYLTHRVIHAMVADLHGGAGCTPVPSTLR